MSRKTRSLSLMLAALCLLPTVSCGEENNIGSNTDTSDTTSAETDEEDVFHGLERKDYGGREFNFLVREGEKWSYYVVESETGDVLDDAVYKTRRMVEEEFNMKFNYVPINGEASNAGQYLASIRQSVLAGDGAYDLIDGYAAMIGGLYSEHIFMNLNDVPSLRLDEDWWSKLVRDELTVNNRIYAMVGDLSQTTYRNIMCMFFNKEMFDELKYEYPYQLVRDGKWTYDVYEQMVKGASQDLNGDGQMDENDRWGAVFTDELALDNFHYSHGIFYTSRNSDGTIEMDLMSEELISLYEKLSSLISSGDVYPKFNFSDVPQIFSNGNALFLSHMLNQAIIMRSEDVEFGILPICKGDEDQEYYYTSSRDGRTMICIPVDVKDADFVGTITEALCVASHELMIPKFYDVALKGKSARDDESGEMIDIARAGLVFDFVEEHAGQTARAGWLLRDCLSNGNNLSSYYAANESKFQAAFDTFIQAYYD